MAYDARLQICPCRGPSFFFFFFFLPTQILTEKTNCDWFLVLFSFFLGFAMATSQYACQSGTETVQ